MHWTSARRRDRRISRPGSHGATDMFVVVSARGTIFTSTDAITLDAARLRHDRHAQRGRVGRRPVRRGRRNRHGAGRRPHGRGRDPDFARRRDVDIAAKRIRDIGDTIDSITWADGQFVAGGSAVDIFGDHDPTPMFTSTDGVTWSRHLLAAGPGPAVVGVAWNGSALRRGRRRRDDLPAIRARSRLDRCADLGIRIAADRAECGRARRGHLDRPPVRRRSADSARR